MALFTMGNSLFQVSRDLEVEQAGKLHFWALSLSVYISSILISLLLLCIVSPILGAILGCPD